MGRECAAISGSVRFMARAYAESAGGDFFRTEGVAFIHGYEGHWTIEAATLPSAQVPLWENEQFDIDADADGDLTGRHAEAFLEAPVSVDVDLSSLAVGELFATGITVDTQAIDTRGGDSGVEAFVRNPEAVTPLVVAAGVRARGEPDFPAPPVTAPAPAVCPLGPAPDAGTLQFSRPDYVTAEAGSPFVLVTRAGGTNGAVSASVITSDGSAEAGADYTALSTTVRFEDGDSSPRLVEIPILEDGVLEPDETFDVSLLDPNCVALGVPSTAEVTIAGAIEQPEPETHTIGGTVTGLEGSGLVLETSGADDLTVDANGPFVFTPPAPEGRVYDVSVGTEPADPDQRCTVANAAGTVAGADVIDILVECSTPPPLSGLDPSFDGDGRTSTLVSSNHVEGVAVQPDGMIVSAGGGSNFTLTRHDADGRLDGTFGDEGIVTTDLGGSDIAMDVGDAARRRQDRGRRQERERLGRRAVSAGRDARRRLRHRRHRQDRLRRRRSTPPTASRWTPRAGSSSAATPRSRPLSAASRTTSPSPGTSRTVIPTRRSEAGTAWSRPMSAPTAISATTSPSTPTAGSCWSARSTRAAAR